MLQNTEDLGDDDIDDIDEADGCPIIIMRINMKIGIVMNDNHHSRRSNWHPQFKSTNYQVKPTSWWWVDRLNDISHQSWWDPLHAGGHHHHFNLKTPISTITFIIISDTHPPPEGHGDKESVSRQTLIRHWRFSLLPGQRLHNQDEAGNNILTQERTNLAKGGVPGPGSGHSLPDR